MFRLSNTAGIGVASSLHSDHTMLVVHVDHSAYSLQKVDGQSKPGSVVKVTELKMPIVPYRLLEDQK